MEKSFEEEIESILKKVDGLDVADIKDDVTTNRLFFLEHEGEEYAIQKKINYDRDLGVLQLESVDFVADVSVSHYIYFDDIFENISELGRFIDIIDGNDYTKWQEGLSVLDEFIKDFVAENFNSEDISSSLAVASLKYAIIMGIDYDLNMDNLFSKVQKRIEESDCLSGVKLELSGYEKQGFISVACNLRGSAMEYLLNSVINNVPVDIDELSVKIGKDLISNTNRYIESVPEQLGIDKGKVQEKFRKFIEPVFMDSGIMSHLLTKGETVGYCGKMVGFMSKFTGVNTNPATVYTNELRTEQAAAFTVFLKAAGYSLESLDKTNRGYSSDGFYHGYTEGEKAFNAVLEDIRLEGKSSARQRERFSCGKEVIERVSGILGVGLTDNSRLNDIMKKQVSPVLVREYLHAYTQEVEHVACLAKDRRREAGFPRQKSQLPTAYRDGGL